MSIEHPDQPRHHVKFKAMFCLYCEKHATSTNALTQGCFDLKLPAVKWREEHSEQSAGEWAQAAQRRKEMRVALMNVITLASDNLFNLFIAAYSVAEK